MLCEKVKLTYTCFKIFNYKNRTLPYMFVYVYVFIYVYIGMQGYIVSYGTQ